MEDQNEQSTIVQPGQMIVLGHQGENLARKVCFDVSAFRQEYPDGHFALAAQRKGDTLPYPAARTNLDGETLIWTLTGADTAIAGYGRCELRCYDGETLAKSEVWQTFTLPSLGEYGEAPEAWQDYVAQMQRIGEKVQEAQTHAPKIGENGNWVLWDPETEQYTDSGQPSRGEAGYPGASAGAVICHLGTTTSAEIEEAYQAGKQVLLPIPQFDAVAQLTGRESATLHHFGTLCGEDNVPTAVYVTCNHDSWGMVSERKLAVRENLADSVFSVETPYAPGDYVMYDGFLYRFSSAHTGAWAAGDVVRVRLAEDVKDLRSGLDGKAAATSVPASASVSAAGVLSFANSTGTQLFTAQLPLYTGGVS